MRIFKTNLAVGVVVTISGMVISYLIDKHTKDLSKDIVKLYKSRLDFIGNDLTKITNLQKEIANMCKGNPKLHKYVFSEIFNIHMSKYLKLQKLK